MFICCKFIPLSFSSRRYEFNQMVQIYLCNTWRSIDATWRFFMYEERSLIQWRQQQREPGFTISMILNIVPFIHKIKELFCRNATLKQLLYFKPPFACVYVLELCLNTCVYSRRKEIDNGDRWYHSVLQSAESSTGARDAEENLTIKRGFIPMLC